jgi:mono/diheme cytochrome c family protein
MKATFRIKGYILLSSVLSLSACENGVKNMYDQAKYKTLAASPVWNDGRASRPLEAGTVAHSAGTLAATASGRRSLTRDDIAEPPTYTPQALQRGRDRFEIFCSPCHGLAGDGNGYIPERGFPHPPTYHSDRLRQVPDSYLFDVMTHGYGVMYPYADRVSVQDRWAIVSYIRALQRSQNASLADVPEPERARLGARP